MPSLEEAQLIAAEVLTGLVGDNFTVGNTPVYRTLQPVPNTTAGKRAEILYVRSQTHAIRIALNGVPAQTGFHSSHFTAGVEHVLRFAGNVNTVGFLSAGGASVNTPVFARWGLLR